MASLLCRSGTGTTSRDTRAPRYHPAYACTHASLMDQAVTGRPVRVYWAPPPGGGPFFRRLPGDGRIVAVEWLF